MKRRIEFRKLKKKDRKGLCHLLTEQEGYKDFFEKAKDAEIYAKLVADQSIRACVYKAVAAMDDYIVGAVIGCRIGKSGLWGEMKKKIFYTRLQIKSKNREVLKYLSKMEQMEQELLKNNQVDSKNMIVLFLIDSRYSNTEIPKNLLREWEQYMKEHNSTSSYIVINGTRFSAGIEDYSKIDEKSVMIQPKVQRFRFHKSLYQKFL